jgi:5,10-methylene-tetrahydrofolate dehydrogenase/methenyl tetrahydrofolate cyclohydrolase
MTKYLINNKGQSVLHKREATKKETKEQIQAEVLKKVDKRIQKFESKRLQKTSLEVMMHSTNPAHPTQKHCYVDKKD